MLKVNYFGTELPMKSLVKRFFQEWTEKELREYAVCVYEKELPENLELNVVCFHEELPCSLWDELADIDEMVFIQGETPFVGIYSDGEDLDTYNVEGFSGIQDCLMVSYDCLTSVPFLSSVKDCLLESVIKYWLGEDCTTLAYYDTEECATHNVIG